MKTTTKKTSRQASKPATKWLASRNGAGEITGYVEAFLGTGGKYFTIPGASRTIDPQDPANLELVAALEFANAEIAEVKDDRITTRPASRPQQR